MDLFASNKNEIFVETKRAIVALAAPLVICLPAQVFLIFRDGTQGYIDYISTIRGLIYQLSFLISTFYWILYISIPAFISLRFPNPVIVRDGANLSVCGIETNSEVEYVITDKFFKKEIRFIFGSEELVVPVIFLDKKLENIKNILGIH